MRQIKRYYLSTEQAWDCSESECACVSEKCGHGDGVDVTVSVDPGTTMTDVSIDPGTTMTDVSIDPGTIMTDVYPYFSSCKYGNVVKLEKSDAGKLVIVEVAIIVQTQGKFFK